MAIDDPARRHPDGVEDACDTEVFRGRFGRIELVEAYESGEVAAAKRVIEQHTEHAKATYRKAFAQYADAATEGGR